MERGKGMLQPPPKGPSYTITLRVVVDKRFDGKFIGYVTAGGSDVPSKLWEVIQGLEKVTNALKNGSYTHHQVGTEAEAVEVIV